MRGQGVSYGIGPVQNNSGSVSQHSSVYKGPNPGNVYSANGRPSSRYQNNGSIQGASPQQPPPVYGFQQNPNPSLPLIGQPPLTNPSQKLSYNTSSQQDLPNSQLQAQLQAALAEVQKLKTANTQLRDIEEDNKRRILQQAQRIQKLEKEKQELIDKLKAKEKEEVKESTKSKRSTQRAGAGAADGENDEDIRALQIALHFEEQERQKRDRDLLMRMMLMGNLMAREENEEERALQRAIEESRRQQTNDPDNMTYEQLLELGDRMGKVSKGLTKEQRDRLPCKLWRPNVTKQKDCPICQENFTLQNRIKVLSECGHEYHDACINKWLEEEKVCPVCKKNVLNE
ncbi:hypothetical protein FGO68_gene16304 [Halteria grandinella]|uniref:RING-type domain-containing protein n=1 Tax=Halteria grandinella TaxID=5974 RepID=A0A8J8P206_HALGN|nr:hypothetical protein FGO68_gene16304 [Halteria grandinella]